VFDDPEGKHNGTINRHTYFVCKDGHGCVAPSVALQTSRARTSELSLSVSRMPCGPCPQEHTQVDAHLCSDR
jgi:hypothetical protein